ncbi:MAG: type I CRISPR-associated protein Cas7 [Tissierellia bacterium]|nr:type I CRISPR-associated protein Cas7 [Tissierellia bacterium]
MKKRVYGVLGISSIMSNWNADFSGFPKTTSDGSVFGSDKALKYPMKKMWEDEGEKVLYIKSLKVSKDEKKNETGVVPRSLKERYEQLFNVEDLSKIKNTEEVLRNIFTAIDVKNFGATFAEAGNNISITGAVQIGQGFNKYADTVAEEQQILSPFRDATKDKKDDKDEKGEAKNSTIGSKIVSNEAHYFYPFAINPLAYKGYVEMGVTNGYTEEDYLKFKKTALVAATAYATNSKIGCENELAIFIVTELDTYLPNLSEYVYFEKREGKNEIRLEFGELLKELMDRIESVEIYYNPYTTEITGNVEGTTMYNIFTQKEV